eukprot:6197732-Pleurochrysis_carterae.AAC.1
MSRDEGHTVRRPHGDYENKACAPYEAPGSPKWPSLMASGFWHEWDLHAPCFTSCGVSSMKSEGYRQNRASA